MGRILESMKAFLTEERWSFEADAEHPVLRCRFTGSAGTWSCLLQAREEQEQLLVYSIAPLRVPTERRRDAAEYLTRANYGLVLGNFELDFSDGEVRFKTSMDAEDVALGPALLRPLLYQNALTMDRYLQGLRDVALGGTAPARAIAAVEGEPDGVAR